MHRLLDRVRVDQLEHADLLENLAADLLGGQVGHQLGDEAAVALGLQLAQLLRLLDRRHHHAVLALFSFLSTGLGNRNLRKGKGKCFKTVVSYLILIA